MKTFVMASLVLIGSIGAALAADTTIPNSTNQHGRDREDFYASIPKIGELMKGSLVREKSPEQLSANTHDHSAGDGKHDANRVMTR
ncbi:hypothetical protein HNR47_000945 [Methylopila jiangsuensis]|nr:hypothetical protein [Methylopila jiangsuensis]MDR6284962.1 hypothetical protein [Methylopila jiangsuensis]